MATYKVIKLFTDLKDGGHRYNVGDPYPKKGLTVTEDRIKELASSKNRQGVPLIEEVSTKETVNDEAPETVNDEAVAEQADEKPKPRAPRKKKSEE